MASVRSVGAAGTAWEPRAEESRAMYLIRERFFRLGEDSEITDEHGQPILQVDGKCWFSMRDTYAVDVAAGQDDLLILASVLALDLAEDEEPTRD